MINYYSLEGKETEASIVLRDIHLEIPFSFHSDRAQSCEITRASTEAIPETIARSNVHRGRRRRTRLRTRQVAREEAVGLDCVLQEVDPLRPKARGTVLVGSYARIRAPYTR